MTTLAHRLRLVDFFALAFGVMVGTAWLVVMDDILQRGGPLGAILGFTGGALMLLPIGYVYGQLVKAIPDAAGEAAYIAEFFPPVVSFGAGWVAFLGYFLTCPFEALAAGRITGYLFPSLNTIELYRIGGYPVYLPHIVLGLLLTVALTLLNYRGIQASARLSKTTTFTFLSLVIVFALAGARHGSVANLHPLFSHTPLLSILLVWQVVPWLVSGFESVGKYAEEASPDFASRNFSAAILLTIFVGLLFFWVVIGAVSFVAPWQSLNSNQQFPTAVAFERALHAHWIVVLIMGSALVALVQAFNANMVASSRLLFAMGRRNLLNPKMGRVHPKNLTPFAAVFAVGIATAITIFFGEALLVPILEVGAVTSAVAWMAACAAYFRMKPHTLGRTAAAFGLLVTSAMVVVKVVPWVPGHFTWHEWVALGIWALLGVAIRASRQGDLGKLPEVEMVDTAG
ncbi:MAG TPA: APC family permease [Terriglobales bacterium]|jgi:APA family basic amino acid/polyamine antiporter|nr:APC family permease [Terriglobales bacterium]